MALIDFDQKRERDVVIIGRATLDFNPNEIHRTLDKVKTFSMYLGGSPGNIAVGLNQLGKKVGFIGCVSNDQFGDFIINFFKDRGIDTTQMTRAKHGERMGLTFTEIKSETESSKLLVSIFLIKYTECIIIHKNHLTKEHFNRIIIQYYKYERIIIQFFAKRMYKND